MLSKIIIPAAAEVQSFLWGLRVSQSSLLFYMPKPLDLTWNFQFLPYTHSHISSSLLQATSCTSTSLLRKTTKATFSATLFLAFCFPSRNCTVHVTMKPTHKNLFAKSSCSLDQVLNKLHLIVTFVQTSYMLQSLVLHSSTYTQKWESMGSSDI